MTESLIGRTSELNVLKDFFSSNSPEFLALYGRRRVGKTYLIRSFFQNKKCHFFMISGIHNGTMTQQLAQFSEELSRVFYHNAPIQPPTDWLEALGRLNDAINQFVDKNQKVVVFLDEFPWLVTHRSGLLEAIDHYWNRFWSMEDRFKLIICGSAAGWMINRVVNNKAGLHNRLTKIMRLDPMSLHETKFFLNKQGIKLNCQHITELYMVTGGIPYYLKQFKRGLSSSQLIEQIAFSKNSFLLNEFGNLYASLFKNSELYIEIMRAISTKRYGMSQEELFKIIPDLSRGGTAIKKLNELIHAGFITAFTPYQHKKKGKFYRAIDEYTAFYFTWIEPIKTGLINEGLRAGYWESIRNTPAWATWAGYAFESICYKHIRQISMALKLSPTALAYNWRYQPTKKSKYPGTQIDLLFDRDDDAITLCEIKYTRDAFTIDKAYAKKLQQRLNTFTAITRTKKQLFLAFISANGVKPNLYADEIVDNVITLEDLFQEHT